MANCFSEKLIDAVERSCLVATIAKAIDLTALDVLIILPTR
jgi:hypothetical protein